MTKKYIPEVGLTINSKLEYLQNLGDEYWSFKAEYKRDHSHKYFRYPAMMVPQMIRKILDVLCTEDSNIKHIHDPFVGSGTILTESILRGLEFTGRDINPLSILLCKVKAGPFYSKSLNQKIILLFQNIENDKKDTIEVNFTNRDKWFRKDVQIDLSRIRRAILEEKSLWARRFFWVAFAETIRLASNSRTTTYKLHIREEEQRNNRTIDAITMFKLTINENLKSFTETHTHLEKNNLLNKGAYSKDIKLVLGDARDQLPINTKYDLVLTSPPYGDNHTTVTYGQYSYLPLQWIELPDIDKKVTSKYLETLSAIDRMSLGGKNYNDIEIINYLIEISPTYKKYVAMFETQPRRFIDKITSFFYDLNQTLEPILENLNSPGYLIWTLGNRTVGGVRIELDEILIELLKAKKVSLLSKIERKIPNKRMAMKNQSSKTISKETILVFKKG